MKELGKPSPDGYYVIVAKKEALFFISQFKGVLWESSGDLLYVKVRSRSLASKLYRILEKKKLLAV